MSDSNDNLNENHFARSWPTGSDSSYESELIEADTLSNEEMMLDPEMSIEGNRNLNSPISPVMLETYNQNPSFVDDGEVLSPHALLNRHPNWRLGSSPAPSVFDVNMDDSDMEPPVNHVNSRLELHPVPASIDLTRNQPSINWLAYQTRVRISASRRLAFPPNSNGGTVGAIEMPIVQRLCAGRPLNHNPTPMVYDPEFDSYIFYNNDTDSEEEAPLPPLVMVPRRGNSISDLSQCSSDYEPEVPSEEPQQP